MTSFDAFWALFFQFIYRLSAQEILYINGMPYAFYSIVTLEGGGGANLQRRWDLALAHAPWKGT